MLEVERIIYKPQDATFCKEPNRDGGELYILRSWEKDRTYPNFDYKQFLFVFPMKEHTHSWKELKQSD